MTKIRAARGLCLLRNFRKAYKIRDFLNFVIFKKEVKSLGFSKT